MPTKTRSATTNAAVANSGVVDKAPLAGIGRSKAAAATRVEFLKGADGDAKRKTTSRSASRANVKPDEKAEAVSRQKTKQVSSEVPKEVATKPITPERDVKASVPTGSAADRTVNHRIDPTASRKAAAAFVAARKKMAPAVPLAPSLKSNDASKGTVQVVDKKDRKTTLDDVKNSEEVKASPVSVGVAAPIAPALAPAATARPFSTLGRGPAAAMKPRPAPSAKGQTFKTGEFIVYPAHGVGQITAIETQEVAGYKLELFVISFVKDKMILKVPLPKIASVGMRKLAEPAVVKRALDTLTGRARIKRTMWSRRAQEYEAKINSGDLVAIAEVVRDLYRSDAQPEQSYSERQLYEAALDRMGRELGVLQKLTDTEALKLIDDQLQKGPRRGKIEDAEGEDGDDAEDGGIGEAA